MIFSTPPFSTLYSGRSRLFSRLFSSSAISGSRESIRSTDLLQILKSRGLLQDCNNIPEFEKLLSNHVSSGSGGKPVSVYCGFDPTAGALHVGNLLQLCGLRWFQRAGFRPIIVLGGATGLIGDPSGRSTERPFLDQNEIQENIKGIRECVDHLLEFDPALPNPAIILNNLEWYRDMPILSFVRDVGCHFRVSQMLAKNSIKSRLASAPNADPSNSTLSFTELSYQLLQAYDFYHLYEHENCRIQIGGSDQWGNITCGIHLIDRLAAPKPGGREDIAAEACTENLKAFAVTLPLVTTSSGLKLGKSAGNVSCWLHSKLTTPYQFYQYFINTEDKDVISWLRLFSSLPLDEIQHLQDKTLSHPEQREAQIALASSLTAWVHGERSLEAIRFITDFLFGKDQDKNRDPKKWTIDQIHSAIHSQAIPSVSLKRSQVLDIKLDRLLVSCSLCQFIGEARKKIASGGVLLNEVKTTECLTIKSNDFIPINGSSDHFLTLRGGKKNFTLIIVKE